MRGATLLILFIWRSCRIFQSTRPMRGATKAFNQANAETNISIHTPHAGRDISKMLFRVKIGYFNPHAPCGARRLILPRFPAILSISIHTPHAGRDQHEQTGREPDRYFNPHAPCGARLPTLFQVLEHEHFNPHAPCGARRVTFVPGIRQLLFQSTRPMRGATTTLSTNSTTAGISIHTPHAGRDRNQGV